VKLTFRAQDDVAFGTPMIGEVTRRVFNHPDADGSELPCSPASAPAFALVFSRRELRPVGGSKGNV